MRKEWTRRLWWLLIINVPTFLIPVSITATTATTDTLEKCLLTSASSSSPSPSLSLSLSLFLYFFLFVDFVSFLSALFSLSSSLAYCWLAISHKWAKWGSNQQPNQQQQQKKREERERERERKRETKRKKPRLTTKETTANRCLGSFQFQLIKVVL